MQAKEIHRDCAFEMIPSGPIVTRQFCYASYTTHQSNDAERAAMKMLVQIRHSGIEILEWLYFCPECTSKLRTRRPTWKSTIAPGPG